LDSNKNFNQLFEHIEHFILDAALRPRLDRFGAVLAAHFDAFQLFAVLLHIFIRHPSQFRNLHVEVFAERTVIDFVMIGQRKLPPLGQKCRRSLFQIEVVVGRLKRVRVQARFYLFIPQHMDE
jgi:hypothetical protein